MSLYRGPSYSASGAKVCKTLGSHAFSTEGVCCSCRIVTDAYTAPYHIRGVSVQSPVLGSPVGSMDPPRIPSLAGPGSAALGASDPTIFRRSMSIVRHTPRKGDSPA